MYSIGDIMKTNKNSLLPIAPVCFAHCWFAFRRRRKTVRFSDLLWRKRLLFPPFCRFWFFLILCRKSHHKTRRQIFKAAYARAVSFAGLLFSHSSFRPYRRLSRRRTAYRFALRRWKITRREACRIMRFNMSGGAGFIITAVGVGILKSKKAGLILFASVTAAAIICAAISGIFAHGENMTQSEFARPRNTADALNKSVEASLHSVLNLSAYIILFCAFQGIYTFPKFLRR